MFVSPVTVTPTKKVLHVNQRQTATLTYTNKNILVFNTIMLCVTSPDRPLCYRLMTWATSRSVTDVHGGVSQAHVSDTQAR